MYYSTLCIMRRCELADVSQGANCMHTIRESLTQEYACVQANPTKVQSYARHGSLAKLQHAPWQCLHAACLPCSSLPSTMHACVIIWPSALTSTIQSAQCRANMFKSLGLSYKSGVASTGGLLEKSLLTSIQRKPSPKLLLLCPVASGLLLEPDRYSSLRLCGAPILACLPRSSLQSFTRMLTFQGREH